MINFCKFTVLKKLHKNVLQFCLCNIRKNGAVSGVGSDTNNMHHGVLEGSGHPWTRLGYGQISIETATHSYEYQLLSMMTR